MQSRRIETKGQSTGPTTRDKKFGTFLYPPHSLHKRNFVTHCKTQAEIQLSNFGFVSLDNIKPGECRQQMQDLCRGYNFLSYVVLSPKTTALYWSGSLEYLQLSVSLALYRWHEEKVSYDTSIPQKNTPGSARLLSHTTREGASLGSKQRKDKMCKSHWEERKKQWNTRLFGTTVELEWVL